MAELFQGFAAQSFQFLEELAKNNHKTWFDAHRDQYEVHVVGAFRALLAALEPFLLRLNPNFETSGRTNRNLSRINRDIRFSKDKSPYKSNYYLRVYDARRSHHTDGCLYVGLSADCLTVGFASYAAWGRGHKSALETVFRPRFQNHPAEFERLLEIVPKKRYQTYWHRQEKGEWTQHPDSREATGIGSAFRPGLFAKCFCRASASFVHPPSSKLSRTSLAIFTLSICSPPPRTPSGKAYLEGCFHRATGNRKQRNNSGATFRNERC